jgi:hypothetical protein
VIYLSFSQVEIQSDGQAEHGHAEYNQLLRIFCSLNGQCFSFIAVLSTALKRTVSADAVFLCDKTAVLGVASKEGSHPVAISLSNTKRFKLSECHISPTEIWLYSDFTVLSCLANKIYGIVAIITFNEFEKFRRII